MPRKRYFFVCLLFFVLQGTAGNAQSDQPNTWSARSSSGRILMGTWTAVHDSASGTVTGTWTLVDANGRRLADGGWSASKTPARWTGNWRAVIAVSNAEYSGTWGADVDLKANASFADLFAKAVQTVVTGNWRYGRQTGAWSIQAVK